MKPEREIIREKDVKPIGFPALARLLAEIGRGFYDRGWALGTSGNFSAVVTQEPLRLAITPTGADKGALTAEQILQIDGNGEPVAGTGVPSDEAKLHLTVVRVEQAKAVLHTHSVWSTILSEADAGSGGLRIEGYEMLKGLRDVHTHEQQVWLPIIENSQNLTELAHVVEKTLRDHPRSHGFLLRRHGLYTWGQNLAEAKRHVEVIEFLLEVMGRTYCAQPAIQVTPSW